MNNILSEIPLNSTIKEGYSTFPENTNCTSYDFRIQSSVDQVINIVQKFDKLLKNTSSCTLGLRDDLSIVLSEALNNAIFHGNNGQPEKFVDLKVQIYKNKIILKIRDEGQGFNHWNIPDPLQTENKFKTHGRGVYIMSSLMDEVKFSKHKFGMEIKLIKYF